MKVSDFNFEIENQFSMSTKKKTAIIRKHIKKLTQNTINKQY